MDPNEDAMTPHSLGEQLNRRPVDRAAADALKAEMIREVEAHEVKSARAWTRAIRRRSADEDIRERPYDARSWMRYFRRYS